MDLHKGLFPLKTTPVSPLHLRLSLVVRYGTVVNTRIEAVVNCSWVISNLGQHPLERNALPTRLSRISKEAIFAINTDGVKRRKYFQF